VTPERQRVALVTGSSRGLGSEIARRLARDGLAVAVNGLCGGSGAAGVVDEIRAAGGVAEAFAADVTDERQAPEPVAPSPTASARSTSWSWTRPAPGPRRRCPTSPGRTTWSSSTSS